jgi:hypothetical protein
VPAVDQLPSRVEMARVGRRLDQHVQDDLAHAVEPPLPEELLGPPRRRRIEVGGAQDLVGPPRLVAVRREHVGGRDVVGHRPGVGREDVLDDSLVTRDDRTEPEQLVVVGQVAEHRQRRPPRRQHRAPQVGVVEAVDDPEDVAALRPQVGDEQLGLVGAVRVGGHAPTLGVRAGSRQGTGHRGRACTARCR